MSGHKIAVITGGAVGLGKAMAKEAAGRGYALFLIDLPNLQLPDYSAQLSNEYKVPAHYMEADLTAADIASKIEQALLEIDMPVGLLVNNAAIGINQTFVTLGADKIQRLIQLNISFATALTVMVARMMQLHGGGHIINVSSLAAYYSVPYKSLYAASKAFWYNLSLSLYCELKPLGIHVSVACPAGILSNDMHRFRYDNGDRLTRLSFLETDETASIIMTEAFKKRPVIIPGRFAKMMQRLGSALPVSWQLRMASKRFGNPMKDINGATNQR